MSSIIECSLRSKNHSKKITVLTKNQQSSVSELKERVSFITQVVRDNTETAEQSTAIARGVSEQVDKMNVIVSSSGCNVNV